MASALDVIYKGNNLETKSYIACSLQSYLSYLESLHNPKEIMTLMNGT